MQPLFIQDLSQHTVILFAVYLPSSNTHCGGACRCGPLASATAAIYSSWVMT